MLSPLRSGKMWLKDPLIIIHDCTARQEISGHAYQDASTFFNLPNASKGLKNVNCPSRPKPAYPIRLVRVPVPRRDTVPCNYAHCDVLLRISGHESSAGHSSLKHAVSQQDTDSERLMPDISKLLIRYKILHGRKGDWVPVADQVLTCCPLYKNREPWADDTISQSMKWMICIQYRSTPRSLLPLMRTAAAVRHLTQMI